ncbi:ABC transporter substrate-binding protein [Acrocarpospora pleiomorpha]|uniref:ABC transporter substrate-binding protein n=1 Tax=Acrocarpospora pleiomorpha TaxID=90975 RepID=A0A5M3XNL3_9ACTN|nr:extracellular solute-binding protein [Acrocarpospora pleiomorpha]GES20733.1 ABC transporter substrate-binding protein [Acrocarpospora pleiomorpha]
MRSARTMTAALAAIILLAACGGTQSGTTDPGAVTGDISPRAITWLFARPSDGGVITTVKEIAAEYAAKHLGFELKLVTTPDRPSYLQRLETLAAAKKLPELFDTDATPFAQKLREQNQMVDIGKLLNTLGKTNLYRPLALDYQRFDDGGLYLLPFEFEMEFFWYNKALFDKAGVKPPASLEDMVALCAPLRAKGIIPIALDGQDQWPLERYLAYHPFRLAGPDYIKQVKRGKQPLTGGPGQKAAQWIHDLGAAKCFPDGFSAQGYTDARDLFTTGKAAMYNIGTWELAALTDSTLAPEVRDNIDYFTLPTTQGAVTSDNEYVVVSGIGMAVNAKTFDPLVKDFLTYLIDAYPARYAAKHRFAPMKVPVIPPPDASPLFTKAAAEIDALGTRTAMPWDTQLDPTSNTRLQQELTLLAQGGITPDQFIATVDEAIRRNAPRFFG